MYKEIFRIAWPVVVADLIRVSFFTIDAIMIGQLGAAALAAVGLGGQILHMISIVSSALSIGVLAICARRKGEGRVDEVYKTLVNAFILATVVSLPATIAIALFSREILSIFKVEESVLVKGTVYLSISSLTIPLFFVMNIFDSSFRGVGDTLTPMMVSTISGGIKVALNYLLIFGKYGFPALGVIGLAISSIVAGVLGLIIYFAVVFSGRFEIKRVTLSKVLDLALWRKIAMIGIPSMVENFFSQFARLLYTYMVTFFGTAVLAANEIGIRIEAYSFMPGFAFSIASASLVGQNLGKRDISKAKKIFRESSLIASSAMLLASIVFLVFPESLSRIFVSDPEVVNYAALYLRIMAFQQPFLGIYMVYAGGIRGSGDTKTPLYVSLASTYSCRIGLGYLLGFVLGLGATGVWLGGLFDFIIRSFLIYLAYKKGNWYKIRI